MSITIRPETPLQDDVRALVEALNDFLNPLSPQEFQFKMTVEQMAEGNTTLFVARGENGQAVGMGALKNHGNGMGEIKRMFTLPTVRGERVGSKLLARLVEEAKSLNMHHLVLETGTGEAMMPAWRLYERGGFTKCGAVLDYPDSEWSAFFEMSLVEQSVAS